MSQEDVVKKNPLAVPGYPTIRPAEWRYGALNDQAELTVTLYNGATVRVASALLR